ncbi:MAG: GNAT family N-acetyltransferase [Kiritimatiellae bacterium]|nr:GNAT family N-acetyltransferase [Kiritimatiellia bacterium]
MTENGTESMGADASRITFRTARLVDAEKIFALIHLHRDRLVPRSLANIVENIDRFTIAEDGATLAGCATYQILPEIGSPIHATVEIQSVAVRSPWRGMHIGRRLVRTVLERVAAFRPAEALVLTFSPRFFAHLGFEEIPKTEVMHKLYRGCINCTKHADPFTCPEKAMRLKLGEEA